MKIIATCWFLSVAATLVCAEPVPLGTEGLITIECIDKPVTIVYHEEHPPLQIRIVGWGPEPHLGMNELTLAWVSNRVGTYNVSDFLRYVDGTAVDIEDTLESVAAFGILPEDHTGAIHSTSAAYNKPALLYASWLKILAGLWLLGLIGLMLFLRKKKEPVNNVEPVVGISLADHLRRLLTAAGDKQLSNTEQATVERLIYTYWQRRLGLDRTSIHDAIPLMRADTSAGSALQDLDALFHRPGPRPDLDQVLEPYRQCSLTELES